MWEDFGVVLFGGHKNFGTSGLTIVVARDDVMERVSANKANAKVKTPLLMDWTANLEMGDEYYVNTPVQLTIWMCQLMCEHMLKKGGV